MTYNRLNKCIISVLIFFLVIVNSADGAKEQIKIAILPCSDIMMVFKKFNPLITYLKQQTGFDISLVVPKGYADFESAMKNGDIDFAFSDPHIYLKLEDLYNTNSLISSLDRKGAGLQHGVVIVRKDSGINNLKDLQGKAVLFGPELSAPKWLAARLLFKENDIDIIKDLRSYSNGGCCEDIAFNVYLKVVDAGLVCDHFLEEHSEKQKELGIDAKQMIVIGRTESVPSRVFAARKGLREDIVTKVNQALLKLDKKNPEHIKILYPAELGGFEKSKGEGYENLWKLLGTRAVE